MIQRGDIWWADLPEPIGSEPGYRRPFVIVQADAFNQSRIRTVLGVALTSNLRLAGECTAPRRIEVGLRLVLDL